MALYLPFIFYFLFHSIFTPVLFPFPRVLEWTTQTSWVSGKVPEKELPPVVPPPFTPSQEIGRKMERNLKISYLPFDDSHYKNKTDNKNGNGDKNALILEDLEGATATTVTATGTDPDPARGKITGPITGKNKIVFLCLISLPFHSLFSPFPCHFLFLSLLPVRLFSFASRMNIFFKYLFVNIFFFP